MAERDARQIHTGVETEDHAAALELRAEELVGRKQLVQTERVLIHTTLVTETRRIEVSVTREELIVERVPPEQWTAKSDEAHAADGPDGELIKRLRALEPGETVRVPLVEEEVVIELQPVVVEEVTIGTRQVQSTRQLSGVVRREEVRVEQVDAK